MNNLKKTLYITVNFLFFIGITVFICFNFDKTTDYFCPIMQKVYTTHMYILIAIFSLGAYLSGYFLSSLRKITMKALCNAYEKRHENISVQKDNDSAKIATLEAKIKTLEVALESALKNK